MPGETRGGRIGRAGFPVRYWDFVSGLVGGRDRDLAKFRVAGTIDNK